MPESLRVAASSSTRSIPAASETGRGRFIQNVLPTPSTLWSPSCPPISETSWRAMACAQPGSAIYASHRVICLRKRFEDCGLLRLRDANARIAHLKADHRDAVHRAGHACPKSYCPLFGKFDRIRKQVQQHLAQVMGVAQEPRGESKRYFRIDDQALVSCLRQDDLDRAGQAACSRSNGRGFQPVLSARLDLRCIENFLDLRQPVAPKSKAFRRFPVATRRVAFPRNKSVIAITPFSGVRISWLTFARNRPFAAFASYPPASWPP